MKPFVIHRRAVVTAALASLVGGAFFGSALASASSYPDRPITLVVPGPPGGTPDVVSRQLAERMQANLGQPVIIDNRAGAAGAIGAAAVAQAAPDGYTLLMGFAQTMAINPVTFKSLSYDPVAGFEPVARVVTFELALVVPDAVPAATVPELVAWLQANGDKAAFGSFGPGTPSQFAGQIFGREAGFDAVHVPYKGSAPLVAELLGGRVHYGFVVPQVALPHVANGRLKILALTGEARAADMPAVPTMTELGYPDVVAGGWYGVFAPKGTPAAVVQRLEQAVATSVDSEAMVKLLAQQALRPAYLDAAGLRVYQSAEIQRWGNIVERTGFEVQD